MTTNTHRPPPFLKIEEAALLLSMTPVALRARCRRAQRRELGRLVAHLGNGILAVKFGRSWRVQFPQSSTPVA